MVVILSRGRELLENLSLDGAGSELAKPLAAELPYPILLPIMVPCKDVG